MGNERRSVSSHGRSINGVESDQFLRSHQEAPSGDLLECRHYPLQDAQTRRLLQGHCKLRQTPQTFVTFVDSFFFFFFLFLSFFLSFFFSSSSSSSFFLIFFVAFFSNCVMVISVKCRLFRNSSQYLKINFNFRHF